MPIKNIKKINSAFVSILEMTSSTDSNDYERLNTICNELRAVVEINKQGLFDLTSEISPKDLQYKIDHQSHQPSTVFKPFPYTNLTLPTNRKV